MHKFKIKKGNNTTILKERNCNKLKETKLEIWYLDSGCSNHMTSHREWLIHFDKSRKSQIRFDDNKIIQAKGTGDILIRRKDGNQAMIKDVLYVPATKSNLISIGQLIEKGFSMNLHQGILELYDPKHRKVLKTPLSANRAFQPIKLH